MAKITSLRVTEQFEHFVRDLRENFWRDVYGQTRLAWKGAQLDRQGASESRPVESGQVKSGLMSDDARPAPSLCRNSHRIRKIEEFQTQG